MTDHRDVHLQLLVPALFGPLADAARRTEIAAALTSSLPLADLERWLSRARRVAAAPAPGLEPLLGAVFGLDLPAGAALPAAALQREADLGDAGRDQHLRADPVHLQAGLEQASLLHSSGPPPGLRLDADESRALAAVVAEVFAEDGLVLEAPAPGRWYLRLPAPPDASFTSPYELAGGTLRERLPGGPGGARWRRLLTAAQTALFEHPVNTARERRGLPAVNSVWFFGAGPLPPRPANPPAGAWSDHELVIALARHAGAAVAAAPADAAAWLAASPAPGRHVVLLEDCLLAASVADAGGWCAALDDLRARWLAPLVAALGEGRVSAVEVLPDAPHGFRLTRGALRAFWRRRQPLAALAAVLDGQAA